jgi:uncharacterized radical SAM protein YgiQ
MLSDMISPANLFATVPKRSAALPPRLSCPCPAPRWTRWAGTECDVILVTGDAYIDHPSFGMALVGRLLEAQGFRVGIISPAGLDVRRPFRALGKPRLYYGITAGNMDSMVNRYTADRKIRSDDAYTPTASRTSAPTAPSPSTPSAPRSLSRHVPVVIGSIEASLRRIAHYDYWSDKVRRSVLTDSKADLLIFGNAERALVDLTHRMAAGEDIKSIRDLRGTAFLVPPAGCRMRLGRAQQYPRGRARQDRRPCRPVWCSRTWRHRRQEPKPAATTMDKPRLPPAARWKWSSRSAS